METERNSPERITRKLLRSMKTGDTVTVQCRDGYDLESQKSIAYRMKTLESCRFSCKMRGLTLAVTRTE